jgi:DNA-binding NtrC family response regulator
MDRILLVDSDISVCASVSRTLAGLGYGVDIAYDSGEARKLCVQPRYRIGLIGERLSDGDGVALFRELHPSQRAMQGVLLSAAANLYTVANAIGGGMSRIISKPIDFRELLSLIEKESPMIAVMDQTTTPAPSAPTTVFDEEAVAALSAREIEFSLSDSDLIQIIRSVDYPFAGKERLEFFDRDTLQRVVHLVRRWCCNRLQRSQWSV